MVDGCSEWGLEPAPCKAGAVVSDMMSSPDQRGGATLSRKAGSPLSQRRMGEELAIIVQGWSEGVDGFKEVPAHI